MIGFGPVAQASSASVDFSLIQATNASVDEDQSTLSTTVESAESVETAELGFEYTPLSDHEAELESSLMCTRGCVLEYHACMWSEWSTSCDTELDVCSTSC